jgi:hypothetical protein
MGASTFDCAAACTYGGNILPGLAPAPVCPGLAAQQACIDAAVQKGCQDYVTAAKSCLTCSVLDGSPCVSPDDCQKYQSDYSCDVNRPGGYCTRACETVDDCSFAGPEVCNVAKAPSFDPQAPATQSWCLLGCQSDADCRAGVGYKCIRSDPALTTGVCDLP